MGLLNGYPAIYMPNHPRAYANGMVYEHILKAEEKLGRKLLFTEVVHHIDHNRTNNSFENLLVFSTQEDHSRFHATDEDLSYLIKNENGSYICPLENVRHLFKRKSNFCPLCGKFLNFGNLYCMNCIKKYHPYSNNKLEREELKQLIRTIPFTTIGKQCNVSDNAVRRWCDTYGLPRTKKAIKNFTDEEWEQL